MTSASFFMETSSMLLRNEGTSKEIPPDGNWIITTRITNYFLKWVFFNQLLRYAEFFFNFPFLKGLKLASNVSRNIIDSDVLYVEQSSNDPSLPRPNTPIVLNFTEMSGNDAREFITISSIALPGPQFVIIDSYSNEPTRPYGFGWKLPFIPPSLSDLNSPPSPFNILATMAVANPIAGGYDENYRSQSPELSEPSPVWTSPMNLSTNEGWETPHTTTDNNIFDDFHDEPRRI